MRQLLLIAVIPFFTSASATESRLPNSFSLHCVPQSAMQDGPVSSDVSYSVSAGWSIAHTLRDGRVFKREQQYVIRDDRSHEAWEGPHRKNRKLVMTGEVVNNNGRYKYIERLYDDSKGGIQVVEIIEDCDSSVSSTNESNSRSNDHKPAQASTAQPADTIYTPPHGSLSKQTVLPVPEEPKKGLTNSQNLTQRPVIEPPATSTPAASPPPAPVTPLQPPASDQAGASAPGSSAPPLLVLVILTGIVILVLVLRMRNRKILTERVLKAVYATISQHKRALVRKRFQTLRHDDYGKLIVEQWQKELRYFVEKVLDPVIRQVGAKEYMLYETMRPALVLTIASQIEEQAGSAQNFTFGPNLTPTDYEQYCAQQLRAAGWSANTTKTSGDQGTDIIAEKGDLRLVVQCKLYNHPVGNKAVQEVVAARAHEQADCAAVVSNYRYTYAAQQLERAPNDLNRFGIPKSAEI